MGGSSFEIGRPRSRGWKNSVRRWRRGVGGLENWTISMDVIYASSLILFSHAIRLVKSGCEFVYKIL